MNVVFRADASLQIGTGHVMRCLTLADALRERAGARCCFICRAHPGHLADTIRARGHRVMLLQLPHEGELADGQSVEDSTRPQPAHAAWLGVGWETDSDQTLSVLAGKPVADWLVVDHYALDSEWERRVRGVCRHLMVIDDLADRFHNCDLLLDQNLGRMATDYAGRVSEKCKIFAGSRYALLRPEFERLRPDSLARREHITNAQNLLISLGGIDNDNATGDVLAALRPGDLPVNCQIMVVMGENAPWLEAVRGQAALMSWPTRVLVNVQNMAQLMLESDLAIGAAGTTSWERCCLGLPVVLITLAENQRHGAMALQAAGAAILAGGQAEVSDRLGPAVVAAVASIRRLSTSSSRICSGDGVELLMNEMDLYS